MKPGSGFARAVVRIVSIGAHVVDVRGIGKLDKPESETLIEKQQAAKEKDVEQADASSGSRPYQIEVVSHL